MSNDLFTLLFLCLYFFSLEGLAKATNIPASKLADTIKKYNEVALAKKDPFGKVTKNRSCLKMFYDLL